MILAGLVLFAIGAADLVRTVEPPRARWIAAGSIAGAVIVLAAGMGAVIWALVAIALGVGWTFVVDPRGRGPARLWPFVVLAALAAVSVGVAGPRADARFFGAPVDLPGPGAGVPLDLAVLVVGVVVFLVESANIAVRSALRAEAVQVESPSSSGLKGGRLIGPLERGMVLALTLASAYPFLAAILASKGIVRFPEISRDSQDGNRAEYFLVGSLVSWSMGLGAALLVWWGAAR